MIILSLNLKRNKDFVRRFLKLVSAGYWTYKAIIILVSVGLLVDSAAYAEILVSNMHPRQGETVEVTIHSNLASPDKATKVKCLQFNGHTYQVFPCDNIEQFPTRASVIRADGFEGKVIDDTDIEGTYKRHSDHKLSSNPNLYQALIAIPADLQPTRYSLSCGEDVKQIVVLPGSFATQKIRLPKRKAELKPSVDELEAIENAKKILSNERLWQGPFTPPSKAAISTFFGLRRIVNGQLQKDYYHSGVDYAASLGTIVKAPANGKVVLAAKGFKLHGNTVCLDHGQGVVSFYIHLQKILVKTGDMVKAGDVIGKVGQTGRANGPHLHFSLYVNEVATNPLPWFGFNSKRGTSNVPSWLRATTHSTGNDFLRSLPH